MVGPMLNNTSSLRSIMYVVYKVQLVKKNIITVKIIYIKKYFILYTYVNVPQLAYIDINNNIIIQYAYHKL